MIKLNMIFPLVLILCFMVGCQDKEAMAELDEFKAQAALEEQNKEIYIQVIKAQQVAFPDYNHTLEDVIVKGDIVILRGINRGTHKGTYSGIPPNYPLESPDLFNFCFQS